MANNIIDKIQISGQSYNVKDSSAATVVELTQQEYDNLPSSAKTGNTLFVITDAQAGDLTQYWTSAQTQSAITEATSGLQQTLTAGTGIDITDNVISATGGGGGGKAIEAGRGISVTTGETADTVSFSLPISAGTGNYSIIEGNSTSAMSMADHAEGSMTYANGGSYSSHAEGYQTSATSYYCHSEGRNTKATGSGCHAEGKSTEASGEISHAEGEATKAMAQRSHAEGYNTTASSVTNVSGIQMYYGYQSRHAEGCSTFANNGCTHTEGYYTQANNFGEHASGVYNVSNSATTTYGDSGNTLFSVGNGTAENARHNAFEIRQNGDIYLSSGGTDIKLQDHLGGGGGGGSSYTAGTGIDITNNVISVTGMVDTTTYDTYTAATDTALSNKQTTLTAGTGISIIDNVISATGGGGGMTEDDELLLSTALVDLNERKIDASEVKSQLGNYQKKGDYVTTNTLNTRLAEYETALDEQNVEEVTAYALNDLNERFGGLKIVKITESEYAALTTKDENTLYIVVADPS